MLVSFLGYYVNPAVIGWVEHSHIDHNEEGLFIRENRLKIFNVDGVEMFTATLTGPRDLTGISKVEQELRKIGLKE
jgi:hypothetical protein